VGITKRFLGLLALGLIVVAAAAPLNIALPVFLIWNAGCFILLLVDYRLSLKSRSLAIERMGPDTLSIFEPEHIGFRIHNTGSRPITVELKDELPDFHFRCENSIMTLHLPPGTEQETGYTTTPTKRGAFTFGSLHIRYSGKLRLCRMLSAAPLQREYRVYPNLKNLKKYRLALCNNRMYKDARRNLKSLGRGTSFESLREYVSGDEYRKINWNATAREGKPIINQYEPEKNQHVHILIDTGRPMSYTVRGNRKLDLVVNTALVLSDIVGQSGDLSGLTLFNENPELYLAPGKGAEHRTRMLEALYHIEHTNRTSNYEEAFYNLRRKERHRGLVFLFTDFDIVEDTQFLLQALPIISRQHTVVLMLIRNEDLIARSNAPAHSTESIFETGIALDFLDERSRVIQILNRRGVFCFECAAESLEYTAVNQYIRIRNKGING